MQNKKLFSVLAVSFLLLVIFPVSAAGKKARLIKAVITEVNGFTITATKNNKTYIINAEKAVLQNAKGKRATIDQFFAGDQINVKGSYDNSGNIVARTIKDQSLKETSLTRRNVGSDNLKDDTISSLDFISNGVITEDKLKSGTLTNASISDSASIDSSKLNLSNVSSLTSGTANITTLNLGTNTIANGNSTGNWNFNSGNLSGIGTIESGNITTSGTVTANGTGNNYFAGNVGIGTTSPSQTLDVGSGYIVTTGRIGIGTTSPSALLSVSQNTTSGVTAARFDTFTTSTSAAGHVIQLERRSTGDMADGFGSAIGFYIKDNADVRNEIGQIAFRRDGADNSGRLEIYTKNAGVTVEAVTVKSSGNVGIGITTPASLLDLSSTTGGILTVRRWDTSVTANDTVGKIQFYAADTSTTSNFIVADIEAQATNTVATDINPGRLIFRTTSTDVAGTPTERMRITETGNVGIGTTAPAESLDINGQMKLKKNSSEPYACGASHDSAISLTSKYTTCVCKNGTGWVLTSDGTTACTWN